MQPFLLRQPFTRIHAGSRVSERDSLNFRVYTPAQP
jgi:hypothetical protein